MWHKKVPKTHYFVHLAEILVCLASGLLVDVEDASRNQKYWQRVDLCGVPNTRIHSSVSGNKDEVRKWVFRVIQWRKTRNLWDSVIGLIAFKYTAVMIRALVERLGWSFTPKLTNRDGYIESLKRVNRVVEPGRPGDLVNM